MHSSALLQVLTTGLLTGLGLGSAAQHSRRNLVCYFEVTAEADETCEVMACSWGIAVDLYINPNPGVACPNLKAGREYSVIGEYTPGEGTTTTTTQPTIITTSTTTSAPGPSITPTMPGAVVNCDRYYKIVSGDSCDTVAQKSGITVAQARSWNTEINASCSNLWASALVCTGA